MFETQGLAHMKNKCKHSRCICSLQARSTVPKHTVGFWLGCPHAPIGLSSRPGTNQIRETPKCHNILIRTNTRSTTWLCDSEFHCLNTQMMHYVENPAISQSPTEEVESPKPGIAHMGNESSVMTLAVLPGVHILCIWPQRPEWKSELWSLGSKATDFRE